jgi:uncharacterized protein (DUF427 family)
MPRAVWNDTIIAESNDTVVIEGNHYFPVESVTPGVLSDSDTTSVCPWKGTAHYWDVVVNGSVNPDAAWHYPEPSPKAASIRGRVAFWKGVRVTE